MSRDARGPQKPFFDVVPKLAPKQKAWVAQTYLRGNEDLAAEACGEAISPELQQRMRMEQDNDHPYLEPADAKQRLLKRLREAGL